MTTANLPDRISRLHKAAVKRGGAFPDEPNPFILDVALWRAWRPGMSIAQTRATMLLEAVRLMPVVIRPEHYGDIPVRVAGYSQKFRLVPRDLQDHIIARTKHRR